MGLSLSENISFNITKKMKNDLDTIGEMQCKSISQVLRECIICGLQKYQMGSGYEPNKLSNETLSFD